MSNGYTPQDRKKAGLKPFSGIVTEEEISTFGVTASGSKHLRVDVKVSGVTVVGSIDIKLQQAVTGNDTFVDLAGANATVSVTAGGIVSMTQMIERTADQPNLPLQKTLKAVLTTTNAGDEVTIENVYISQGL